MIIALGIVTVVFAAVLPQLSITHNSWDSKQGASETLQNGRVLMDHLYRNLSKAVRITAVSGPDETNGYIEFKDNDANTFRYDIGAGNYVEFGLLGNLSDLAGPVTKFQFTCYDAFNLTTSVTDVDTIRSVKVEAVVANSAQLGSDMTFTTQVYIRTNSLPAAGDISKLWDPWFEFDVETGQEPALAQISATQYLCVHRGASDDGFARILTVDLNTWAVTSISSIEYDTKQGVTPALAKIDDSHFLCAYQGDRGDGRACVFTFTAPNMLTTGPGFEFDTADCIYPALCQIDGTHYLCAYDVQSSICRAVVLTVDTMSWSISKGPTTEFATALSPKPALAKIDETHYLCAYGGPGDRGYAVVLTVNTGDWSVATEAPFEFDASYAADPALAKIDDTHYLCAYQGNAAMGCAMVLVVNRADWTAAKAEPSYSLFEPQSACAASLCKIDAANYLCAYEGMGAVGKAVVLTVDIGSGTITPKTPFTFESVLCATPALCQVNAGHYLCAHSGPADDGYAGVLELGSAIVP
jgi:hypothetical protein